MLALKLLIGHSTKQGVGTGIVEDAGQVARRREREGEREEVGEEVLRLLKIVCTVFIPETGFSFTGMDMMPSMIPKH